MSTNQADLFTNPVPQPTLTSARYFSATSGAFGCPIVPTCSPLMGGVRGVCGQPYACVFCTSAMAPCTAHLHSRHINEHAAPTVAWHSAHARSIAPGIYVQSHPDDQLHRPLLPTQCCPLTRLPADTPVGCAPRMYQGFGAKPAHTFEMEVLHVRHGQIPWLVAYSNGLVRHMIDRALLAVSAPTAPPPPTSVCTTASGRSDARPVHVDF